MSKKGLGFLMLFGLFLCIFAAPARASASAPESSPAADTDLICHTSNPGECYPRMFQPTDEFQIVHDDQELPKGLHVRLNIMTGKKEAKINVPDEVNPALEGLPVDQAVMVVDPEQDDALPVPKGAPAYDAVGKIKEPEVGAVGRAFFDAVKMLKKKGVNTIKGDNKAFDVALEGMEDLSHDIYYGLKIAEDPAVVKGLFCLMVDQNQPLVEGVTPRDQQAAAILGGALQNHPSALKAVNKEWSNIMAHKCSKASKPLSEVFYGSFMPSQPLSGADAKAHAARVKARVSAISGLIKSDTIRAEFLKSDGMRRLLEVLVPDGKEWASAQRKVGQLVVDTFLDEDMGAKLGQWPRVARVGDLTCKEAAHETDDGCWDYHVERIMRVNKKDKQHWSRDLFDRLTALNKDGNTRSRVEL